MVLMASCSKRPLYTHYEHVPIDGWEKNDILSFDIPPVKESGYYRQDMCLRVMNSFPFLSLNLVVKQTVLPSGYIHTDTVSCSVYDRQGNAKGPGVSYYQYKFHFNTIKLLKGDSLHISVKHNMKREIMPGVSDIGIQMDFDRSI